MCLSKLNKSRINNILRNVKCESKHTEGVQRHFTDISGPTGDLGLEMHFLLVIHTGRGHGAKQIGIVYIMGFLESLGIFMVC